MTCEEFDKILNSTEDPDEATANAIEKHLRGCERHRKMILDDEAAVAPRLKRFGRALNDALDRGVAEGTPWENIPSLIQTAARDNLYDLIQHIINRCIAGLSDPNDSVNAFKGLLIASTVTTSLMKERIADALTVRTCAINNSPLSERITANDAQSTENLGTVCALELLWRIEDDELVLERKPPIVTRYHKVCDPFYSTAPFLAVIEVRSGRMLVSKRQNGRFRFSMSELRELDWSSEMKMVLAAPSKA